MKDAKLVMARCRSKGRAGFTFVEIMIVVIIIAALAAMVVPRLTGRGEQAKEMIARADVNSNIDLALKLYELDNGTFPTTAQGLAALLERPSSEPVPKNWNGPYLERDPLDPWGNEYRYAYPGRNNPFRFDLYSPGRDGRPGTDDDITNW